MQNLLAIPRHLLRAKHYRIFRSAAFDLFEQVTCAWKKRTTLFLTPRLINVTIPPQRMGPYASGTRARMIQVLEMAQTPSSLT